MRAAHGALVRLVSTFSALLLVLGVIQTLPSMASPADAATTPDEVSYAYDAAGRLAGVTDRSGATARYEYDAAGNVAKVTNLGSPAVSVLSLVPASGSVGSTVTLSGGPFEATPTDDTVSFNGTPATVRSASTHRLVVTVPTGATSGPVSVTTSSGTGTSADAFTVTADQAPTLTSVSPSLVAPGEAFTLAGSNFDTTLANDVVTVNATYAGVTSVSPASLTATTPLGTTSGRVSIRTPDGTATSTDDLFIVPSPYVKADVTTTTRIPLDTQRTVAISTGRVALVVFDLPAGQRATVSLSGGTFGNCGLNASVLDPRSKTSVSTSCVGTSGFLDQFGGNADGTYELVLAAQSGATGSIAVSVNSLPADATKQLTIDGPAQTVTNTVPGQNASFTFDASSGQRVQVQTSGSTYPCCGPTVRLYKPDGSQLWSSSGNTLLDTTALPADGTYRLFVDPSGGSVGSITAKVWSVPADSTGTMSIDGGPQTLTTAAGQNASVTFDGTAGQRVQVQASGSTYPCCGPTIRLYQPDGTQLWSSSGNTLLDTTALPADGTYRLFLDPSGASVGSITVQAWSVPDDSTGATSIDAPAQAVTTAAGQNANLTFDGTAGQRVQVETSGSTYPCCGPTVRLYKPDGTQLWSSSGNTLLDTTALPADGTYRLLIDPSGASAGSITVKVRSVPDDSTATMSVDGPVQTVSTVAGQNANLTFDATAGQRIQLQTSNSTYPCCGPTVRLYKPDGTQLWSSSGNTLLDTTALPADGTYRVLIDPSGASVGSIKVQAWSVPADSTAATSIDGPAQTVTTVAGQNANLTFDATTGQRVQVETSGSTYPCCGPSVRLYKPDGTQLWSSSGNTILDTTALPADGTYRLFVDPSGASVGSITVKVRSVPADVSGSLTLGGAAQTVTTVAGQNATLTFDATSGQRIQLQTSGSTYPCCGPTVRLYQPGGTLLWSSSGNTILDTTTLPADGTYQVLVDPSGSSTGSIAVQAWSVPAAP
jgi:YD repeat-containing protein